MKRILVIFAFLLAFLLAFANYADAKTLSKTIDPKATFYLTVQAENGSIRQKVNEDGSITCTIKFGDVVRVSAIILNGDDITSQLEKNKFSIPALTRNTTLEVTFENSIKYLHTQYTTIATF